jgi:hypothetical protein
VFWNIKEAGIRIYSGPNSLTTTVTKGSLKMAPFKVLYGHRCHTPLN